MMPSSFISTPSAPSEDGTTDLAIKHFLGTDDLVLHLRALIPGGISKRTVYQWCDMGCPHVQMPGAKRKLIFVMADVLEWVMSHKVERDLYAGRRGMA